MRGGGGDGWGICDLDPGTNANQSALVSVAVIFMAFEGMHLQEAVLVQ